MKEIADKLLVEMYNNTKSESTRREVKKELLTRGYRFVVKEKWNWNPGWQTLSAGGTIAGLLFISFLIWAFKDGPQPVEAKSDAHKFVSEILNVQQESDLVALKKQVVDLQGELKSVSEKNKELEAKWATTNERLWRFGVMNQENWCRFNGGEKNMVLMNEHWFPNQKLRHLPDSINTRLEEKKTVQEAEGFNIPQPNSVLPIPQG